MPTNRPLAQVDVFSESPYLGNPVAVVLDADDVSDEQMQQIARWTNLSETTFLMAPTDPGADYRVRIFTPGGELPFAGHPTLGSAHAWLEAGGRPRSRAVIVQQCTAGLVPVRRGAESMQFAAPERLRTGPLDDDLLDRIVAALGITRDRVVDHEWVDNGPGWAVVRLATAQQVLELDPDFARFPDAMVGAIGFYPEGSEHTYELRAFAPRIGVAEDPVCGSMNAGVGQWLTKIGAVPASYRVSQGVRVGRAGSIQITADEHDQVWVGGACRTLIRGTISV